MKTLQNNSFKSLLCALTDTYRYFANNIDLTPTTALSQRKTVDLGKVFSRIIALHFVLKMMEKGSGKI